MKYLWNKLGMLTAVAAVASACSAQNGALPHGKPSAALEKAFAEYVEAVEADSLMNVHSIMVLQHGKVLEEKWFGDQKPEEPHVLWSVSKTFTAAAVGFAVSEGKLRIDDKVIGFFPEDLPDTVSENLAKATVKDLLTMTFGHDTDPTNGFDRTQPHWAKAFLSVPVVHEPGTFYCYNTLGTFMLSAIVQKVTGEKVVDYLQPRLWEPLQIEHPEWLENPDGITAGGYGLYLKTEDLAKMGLLLLNYGKWNGKQVLPREWVEAMTSYQVPCCPSGTRFDQVAESGLTTANSDWVQGYGYQMWLCRHGAVRADGAFGQYILVMREQDAVVAMTAQLGDMQAELNMVWDRLLPVL